MKRRVLGILLALALAVLGTVLLVKYVQKAKKDATKGEQQVALLVLTDDVTKGATLSQLKSKVEEVKVPVRLRAEGALDLAGLLNVDPTYVSAIDLKKGDQVLSSRLVDPRTLVHVAVPSGLQEITVALSPERAVGANLSPGDTVGVIFSFDPFDIATSGAPNTSQTGTSTTLPARTPNTTHFTLHKVLVTSVQFSKQDSQRAAEIKGSGQAGSNTSTTVSATVVEAPSDQLLITMAVTASEAEQIVFASEFGHVWLTNENAAASEDGTRILTLAQVYVPVPK
jgi:pilus assembly protein CpaB